VTNSGGTDLLYRVNDRDEIVFVNETWTDFARSNGGDGLVASRVLGRSLWDYIADATTRQVYFDVLKQVRAGRTVQFRLRCDSPSYMRLLEMRVAQVAAGVTEFRSRVIWEEPQEYQALLEPDRAFSDQFLHVCAWCKKINVAGVWAEVEDAVISLRLFEHPLLPQLTHGICPSCHAEMMDVVNALSPTEKSSRVPP
jgi:hypothetical protein